ncbi:uncharacterized protein LOC101735102 [Xenopus tropicalis]|uniref:Uncharacterized protein LOC101735102 n=1 Tax=Xenopus tropicalis TaxID=8364 RepID=A0A8J1IZP0_XENTR|nr:uncharacterized protein LOC101735102 [Xenopus tropicalis]
MDAKSLESRCCCPCLSNGISGTIPRIQQSLRTALGYTGLLFLMGQIISITLWLYYGYKSVFDWTLLGAVALNTGICIMGICSGAITPPCPKAVCPLSDMLQKIEWLSVAYTSISKFIMLGYSISLLVLYCLRSDNGKVENWILILIIIIILGLLIDVVTCVCIYRGCRQDPSPAVTKAEGEILPEMEQLNPPGAMDGGPVGIVAVLC